jgi:NAD(P)H-hydrate repair Nnr-like enzyme with NAD(P)H-hydrate dehydratase domain
MNSSDYITQGDEPLFPKIIWNRPISRHGAGRLLVVGGYLGDFSLPTIIYGLANAAGIGECIVALPDKLSKFLDSNSATVLVPSSIAGSIGANSLGQLLELAGETDAVAIGAGLSNNSETASVIEKFIIQSDRPTIIFADALDALKFNLTLITDNPDCLLIMTMQELFKVAGLLNIPISIRRDGGLINKLEIIESIKSEIKCDLVIFGTEIIVSDGNKLSVTKINRNLARIPAIFYAVMSVFWLQNNQQKFEGLTTGAWIISQLGEQTSDIDQPSLSDIGTKIMKIISE